MKRQLKRAFSKTKSRVSSFSTGKRVLALVLAVAMVFSVIYISSDSKESKVKADETVTLSGDFLINTIFDSDPTKFPVLGKDSVTTVNYPNIDGVTLKVTMPDGVPSYPKNLYKTLGENPIYSIATDSELKDVTVENYRAKLGIKNAVDTADRPTVLTISDGSSYVFTYDYTISSLQSEEETEYTSVTDIVYAVNHTDADQINKNKHTIKFSSYDFTIGDFSVNNSKKEITAPNEFAIPDGVNPGTIQYFIDEENTHEVAYDKLTEVADALETSDFADGEHTVFAKIYFNEESGYINIASKKVTRAFNIIKTKADGAEPKAYYTSDSSKLALGTTGEDGKSLTITDADPRESIDITFDALTEATVSATKKEGTGAGETISAEGNKISIEADKVNTNGKTFTYTVNASKEGYADDTFTVTITYKTGSPNCDSYSFTNSTVETGDTAYFDADTKGVLKLRVSASDVKTSDQKAESVEIYRVNALGGAIESNAKPISTIDNPDDLENPGKVEDIKLNPGNNYFAIRVNSVYGNHVDVPTIFNAFYDADLPEFESISLTQDSERDKMNQGDATGTWDKEENVYKFDKKMSSSKDAVIKFKANDGEGSGIKEVKVGTDVITAEDGVYSVTVPANTEKSEQEVTVKVVDNANNEVEKTFKVTYFDEKPNVTGPSVLPAFLKTIDGLKDTTFVQLSLNDDTKKVVFTYQIESPVTIDEKNITASGTNTGDIDIKLIDDGTDETSGNHKYTLNLTTSELPENENTNITDVKFDVTNSNGANFTGLGGVTVVDVDLKKPTETSDIYIDDKATKEATEDTWYSKLFLRITPEDIGGTGFDDNNAVNPISGLKPGSIMKDGSYIFEVEPSTNSDGTKVSYTVTDRVGNTAECTGTYLVDAEAPSGTLVIEELKDGNTAYNSNPTFSGTATDNIGIKSANLVIKDNEKKEVANVPVTVNDDSTFTVNITDVLSDGDYTATLELTDNAGNPYSPDSIEFKIDTEAPRKASITAEEAEDGKQVFNPLHINLSVSDENLVTDRIKVTDTVDEVETVLTPEFTVKDGKATAQTEITTDGTHTIKLEATDAAGNEMTPVSKNFIFDKTVPVIKATLAGEDFVKAEGSEEYSEKHVSDNADFAFKVNDAIDDANSFTTSITATYTRTDLDGAEKEKDQEITGGEFTTKDSGTYVVTVTATDTAGNTAKETFTFVVNNIPPKTSATLATTEKNPVDGMDYLKTDALVNLTAEGYDIDVDDTASFVIQDNGTAITPTYTENWAVAEGDTTNTKFSAQVKILLPTEATKKHVITVVAKTRGGKTSGEGDITASTFTLDSANPLITTKLNSESYDGKDKRLTGSVTISVSNDDANATTVSGTLKYKDFNGNPETSEAVSADAATPTQLSKTVSAEGTYTLELQAADKARRENTKTISFVIDNSAPVIAITPSVSSKVVENYFDQKIKLNISVTDNDLSTSNIVIKDNDQVVTPDGAWSTSSPYTNTLTISLPAEEDETATHNITVEATDRAGHPTTKPITVVMDSKNPVINTKINGEEYTPSDNTSYQDVPSVTGTVNEKNQHSFSGVVTRTDFFGKNPEVTDFAIGKANEFGKDGIYSIAFAAMDKSGRTTTRTIKFSVDNQAPKISLTKDPSFSAKDSRYYNHGVTIPYTVTDDNIKSFTLKDNGNTVASGTANADKSYSVSTEGPHTIVLTAIDKADNEVEKSIDFIIDTQGPSLSSTLNGSAIGAGEAERYLRTDGTVGINVSDNYGNDTSDITQTVVATYPNKNTSTSTTKTGTASTSFSQEADYAVTYEAVDLAGNKTTYGPINFRVDKTAPALRITGASGTVRSDSSVTYTIDEAFYWDVKSATVKVYKKIDGSGESLLRTVDLKPTSASYSQTEGFAEDGEYRFEFDAEDMAGNTSNTTYTFILDKNAPTISLSVKNYTKTNKDVAFGVTIDENFFSTNTVTMKGTRETADGKKEAVKFDSFNANAGKTVNFEQIFKQDGIYDIDVTSTDKAGNSTTKTVHFTIDKSKPVISNLEAYDGKTLNAFNFDSNMEGLVNDLTACNITVYLDGVEYDGNTKLKDGTHVLKIVAKDELGNSSEKEVSFLLDTKAPTIIVNGIKDGQEVKDPTKIDISVQINEDILSKVTLNGQMINIVDNRANLTVDKKGDYELTIIARDLAGNKSEMTIHFTYGSKFNWVLFGIIAGIVVLLAAAFIIIAGKKRNKGNE